MAVSTKAGSRTASYPYGGDRFPQDHWQFFESMPQKLTNLIDDLSKMGICKPQALNLANNSAQVEMKEALNLAFANPSYQNKGVFPCQ
ncbi:hypothetical protein H6F95_20110 [Cyanobacteria bacterium FACHB-471]|nr:hypothetical protein [Cyanobacteria bacterium FACHB-471]